MKRKILPLFLITIFLAGCAGKNLKEENEKLKAELAQAKEKEAQLVKQQEQYEKELADLKTKFAVEEKNGDITINKVKGGYSLGVTERLFFATGKAYITPSGKKVLNKIAEMIKNLPDKSIRIEGHADNKPIRKGSDLAYKYPTNWELAAARAINVARYLTEKAGVDPAIVSATSYSMYRPIASNDTKKGRAKNRRIEIIIVDKEALPAIESEEEKAVEDDKTAEEDKSVEEDKVVEEDKAVEGDADTKTEGDTKTEDETSE